MAAAMAAMEVVVMLLFSQTQVFLGLQWHQDFQDGLESRFLGCTPKMGLQQLEAWGLHLQQIFLGNAAFVVTTL